MATIITIMVIIIIKKRTKRCPVTKTWQLFETREKN